MTASYSDIKEKLGLVHVYTGNGKGKTTASLGLAFRAMGRGLNVLMVQFLKPPEDYGEHISARECERFSILPMGLAHLVGSVPSPEDIAAAGEALEEARERIHSGEYDLVILDECNVAMSWKLIDPGDVIDMLSKRPPHIEIVLTGRGAPEDIVDYADLVTEMRMVKHPFDRRIGARMGIEY
ncbi:MAG: cob(I)yrinic acid a,c-diamide adenosyltransferase [Euryarchaeota archaeon]|nr:cob(I)yrinic acid a,c-diamide adenosyltransferase [Euryarchaeota archaeon]